MTGYLMAVGSLNRAAPYFTSANGIGLSIFRFDSATGNADPVCDERSIDNPSFLTIHPTNGCLYANSEVFGWHEGTVTAYRFDTATRRLVYLNKQPSLGSITAHSSVSHDGRHLFVANYAMFPQGEGPDQAVVAFPLGADGRLLGPATHVAHRGQGPDSVRQERAHPHCVLQSPDSRFVVVADLGLDALLTYAWLSDRSLSADPVARLALPSGSGPRHFAFHPNGRLAVVICELRSTISTLQFDPKRGAFSMLDTIAATPADSTVGSHCSDVQIHPDGRLIFGANRGHDSIAIAICDLESGRLRPVATAPCGGSTPRHLAIDPTGRFLLVANQDSDGIAVFMIDPHRGELSFIRTIPIGSPMCIKFFAGPDPAA